MNITSANAVLTLSVTGLSGFTSPQVLQQFSAEDIYTTDPQTIAETVMGVDGRLSAGYTPMPVTQQISLMADSASMDLFEQWSLYSLLYKTVYPANGVIILQSIGKQWTMNNGVLTIYPTMPNAAKILQARRFTIIWESVIPAPV